MPNGGQGGDSNVEYVLYTDGSCIVNPGPGGWAFVLVSKSTGKRIEKSGGEKHSTNNRMELTAVIEGLRYLEQPSHVLVASDSTYVLRGLSEWIDGWAAKNWRRWVRGQWVEVPNNDLWQVLYELRQKHHLEYKKVKAHSGHTENERCDALAGQQAVQFDNYVNRY